MEVLSTCSLVERVFSAIYMAAKQHTTYRIPREGEREPKRNVMLICFTDEAGDDVRGLDQTITYCRRFEFPVYVVGVPAPQVNASLKLASSSPDQPNIGPPKTDHCSSTV